VDVQSVDVGLELIEFVEAPLLFTPVKLVMPVLHELFHVRQIGSVVPAGALDLIREPRPCEPFLQIIQDRLRDADLECLTGERRGSTSGARSEGPADHLTVETVALVY